jgi:hypothetical protein
MNLAVARAPAGAADGTSRPSSASPIGMDTMIEPEGLKLKEWSGGPP